MAASFSQERLDPEQGGGMLIRLAGDWRLADLAPDLPGHAQRLAEAAGQPHLTWCLTDLHALDSAGAVLLWHAWGCRLPDRLQADPGQLELLQKVAEAERLPEIQRQPVRPIEWLGRLMLFLLGNVFDFLAMLGQLLLDCLHCLRYPKEIPWKEISANVYKSGVRAMPVAGLVGFLIGVVLSYLSALQLKAFGADIYIVNILGLGIVRELGPVLVAVLVAGRSGSAMTAQLGVMRVTEEIDALATMGVSRSQRLILPKVVALTIAMPLLVLWTDVISLCGGMFSAEFQLDISYAFFIEALPKAVPVANLWIGLLKGMFFGATVALIACHFGLRVKPNTESLSAGTTSSVVTAITSVILVDAVFAIASKNLGLPL